MELINISEDLKIINKENDLLNTVEKADAINNFINNNEEYLKHNNLIAIYGKWGSGKSCLMKTVENKLDKNKYKTLWFNTWMYEKDKNLPFSLLKYILKDRKLKKILNTGKDVLESMVYSTEINLGPITFNSKEALDHADELDNKNKSFWEEVEEFKKEYRKLSFKGKKLIVFLDDLDRCDSNNIINLISSIKLFLSINENIIFILGIDREAVTLALQNKYNNDFNKADEYLEKIFPINFLITSGILTNDKNIKWISEITNLDLEKSKNVMDFLENVEFTNPRHLKKVFRKYLSIKDYLINNNIDLEDENNIIFIIYIIILALFYEREYIALLTQNKDKYYSNVFFRWNSKNEENIVPFSTNVEICENSYGSNRNTLIFQFIEKFSSYNLKNYNVEAIGEIQGIAISISAWQALFDDCICKRFVEYVYNSEEICKWLINKDHDTYGIKYIDTIIKYCNNII